jgi:hypothetical protein
MFIVAYRQQRARFFDFGFGCIGEELFPACRFEYCGSALNTQATMNSDKNRKRAQDLRRVAFQSLLTGIVIILGLGCIFLVVLDKRTGFLDGGPVSQSSFRSIPGGRGLGLFLFSGVWGLWMIVRGAIYLIRALSGNEQYAKTVVDTTDKFESRQEAIMKQKVANGSTHNVLVLLVWVLLFITVIGAIVAGYLFWTRPR